MSDDLSIDLIGDEDLLRALNNLNYVTQHKVLKKILSDTATKTFVKELKRESPVGPTGNLRRSMGKKTGKSRRVATVFAGPRMSHSREKTNYSGWLANIIEFNKFQDRYPGKDRRGVKKKRPRTPHGIRVHSGVFPLKPFVIKTILRTVRVAEDHIIKSVRTVIEREWKKHVKNR